MFWRVVSLLQPGGFLPEELFGDRSCPVSGQFRAK